MDSSSITRRSNKYYSYLDAKRVGNATKKLDMSTIKLACPLSDPEEMGRAIIVEARGRVLTSERLLIGEEQALMGGPELSGGHDRMVHGKPSSSHEPQGLVHPVGQLLVPVSDITTTSAPTRLNPPKKSW